MDVNTNKISGSGAVNTDVKGEVKSTEYKGITGNYVSEFNDKIVSDVSKKSRVAGEGKNRPVLSKNIFDGKNDTRINSVCSLNEIFSLLTDFYSGEKLKFSFRAHKYNHNLLSGLWSEDKENELSAMISDSGNLINKHIDGMADYYFLMMNENCNLLSDMPEGELKSKLTGKGGEKFESKSEIALYLRSKTNTDEVIQRINTESEYCKHKTELFKLFSDELNKLPIMNDETGLFLSVNRDDINIELDSLDDFADIQDDAKDIMSNVANLFVNQRKSDISYTDSLTELMGKIADLRDKLAQKKLENDRLITSIQQKTLQDKVDADSAEMAEKIKKAERLQALFKWLGPLLTCIMALLAALTGGVLAQALAIVVTVVTVINEVIKATGGPDLMAEVMTPVTKLMEAIQTFIKDIAMKLAKAMGKSPEELKELEKTMEVVSMLLSVVVVMAAFAAAGAVAGKVIGQVASETTKEILKQVFAEVKKLLIAMMLTSTVVKGANSVTQAKLNEVVMKLQSDIDFDQDLLDKLMELMEKIMATFSESQQELNQLKEKLSKIGKDAFQREKAIIQQRPLAV